MGAERERAPRSWPTGTRARLEVSAGPGLGRVVGEQGLQAIKGALGGVGFLIEEPDVVEQLARAVTIDGDGAAVVARLRTDDGSTRWTAIRVRRTSGDDGGFTMVIDLEDVSAHQRAERAERADTLAPLRLAPVAAPQAASASPTSPPAGLDVVDIRRGAAAGELRALLQPQVCLLTRAVIGFEALAAWEHPSHGLLRARFFIDAAIAAGVIDDVLRVVLDDAVLAIERLTARGIHAPVSVNLAPDQLRDARVAELVHRRLSERTFDPEMLTLEVPAWSVSGITAAALDGIRSLRDVGVSVFLDECGAADLPDIESGGLAVDGVKLAASLVAELPGSDPAASTVRGLVTTARARGMRVVGLGVETPDQSRVLRALGCEEGQGYLFARPMSVDSLPMWMAQSATTSAGVTQRVS